MGLFCIYRLHNLSETGTFGLIILFFLDDGLGHFMNSFFSALRNTTGRNLPSRFNVLKSSALVVLAIGAINSAAMAADLPGTVFVEPPEGMIEDSEGRFFAKLSALAMHRGDNPNVFLAGENAAANRDSINSLNGNQLSNGWSPGFELVVGANDVKETSIGKWNVWARGQLIGRWSDDRQLRDGNNGISPFVVNYATPATVFSHGITDTGSMNVDYSSTMWSLDANVEYELENKKTSFFGGLRYIRLEESLDLYASSDDFCFLDFLGRCTIGILGTPANFDLKNQAINNMFGLQIGIDQKLVEDKNGFSLGFQALLGLAANDIETSASGTAPVAMSFPRTWYEYAISGRAEDVKLGLFAEGNISSKYEFNDSISLELGYRALWLQKTAGVVRAIPNLDPTGSTECTGFGCTAVPSGTGGGRIETDDMLLHGGRLGLKVRF